MRLTDKDKELIRATMMHIAQLRAHVNALWQAGYSIDSERTNEVNEAITTLISQVEKITETEDWIEWFVYENELGAKELEAGYNGQFIAVCSIDDLFTVIDMGKNE